MLYVAEVESRCQNTQEFLKNIERFGFQLKENSSQKYFFLAKFNKIQNLSPKATIPRLYLKPCLYKKRWIRKYKIDRNNGTNIVFSDLLRLTNHIPNYTKLFSWDDFLTAHVLFINSVSRMSANQDLHTRWKRQSKPQPVKEKKF